MTPAPDQDSGCLDFSLLDLPIRIRWQGRRASILAATNYGHLSGRVEDPKLEYAVEACADETFTIIREPDLRVAGLEERKVLLAIDYDLMIQLQLQRPDLLFIHSAVLELEGNAILFPAPAGTGKSTLAWSLERSGLRYMSDELAPIDARAMTVFPFPRAICLKTEPPGPHRLPDGVVRTAGTFHVPNASLREPCLTRPVPVGALVFPRRADSGAVSHLAELSDAEAAARLYSNALNPKAHPASGLDAALSVASRHPCFELAIGDLESAADLIVDTFTTDSDDSGDFGGSVSG